MGSLQFLSFDGYIMAVAIGVKKGNLKYNNKWGKIWLKYMQTSNKNLDWVQRLKSGVMRDRTKASFYGQQKSWKRNVMTNVEQEKFHSEIHYQFFYSVICFPRFYTFGIVCKHFRGAKTSFAPGDKRYRCAAACVFFAH